MSYRYHLKEHGGRCATAIVELDSTTLQPKGRSQWLKLSGPTGTEHHEDARLFLFNGKPHVSYSEMRGYRPGVDYSCVVKYAELRLRGANWDVVEVFQPRYGRNDGRSKEKNWVFFEHDKALYSIYSGGPQHTVIKLDEETVTQVYETAGPAWHFGSVRGGTPPVRLPDGTMMVVFHSSLPTEVQPHYVRYYSGIYTIEGAPPFTPLRCSTRPLMVGSEEDGHKVDPRFVEGWKPYVVFPCGLVEDGPGWLVSLGVNDWQCAIAKLKPDQLHLGAANGSDIQPRYFRRANGSLPVKYVDSEQRHQLLNWMVPRSNGITAGAGYLKCASPREAQVVSEVTDVEEISFEVFEQAQMRGGRGF